MPRYLAVFLFFASAAAHGQNKPAQNQLAWSATARPEIQKLSDSLIGSWSTVERLEPNRFMKAGADGSGTFNIHNGPGANSLILDYTSHSSMGDYSSTRIIYWDTTSMHYKAFYCDSLQPAGCGEAGEGTWEGGNLVFNSTTHGPDGPLKMKQTLSGGSGQSFTLTLDIVDHGKLQRSLTITAKRTAANP